MKYQFMFELGLPFVKTEEFVSLIPEHRAYVNDCLVDGRILNYSLTTDMNKVYCVIESGTEQEAYDLVADMPLAAFMKIEVKPLMFHNAVFHQDFQFSKTFNPYFNDKFFNGLSFEFAYENPMSFEDPTENNPYRGYFKQGDTIVVKFSNLYSNKKLNL